ncbi:MAG: type II toxin-antitoxin system RelE/ParE family toxin [Candidatus Hydrogenedentes bacterium]|nr:type II toxin-antitoxin system RelE/ParE family toxin [Candidatus Hydrogenedentota bacterium]
MQTIVELPEFVRRAAGLLTDDEKRELLNYLASEPRAGVLVQGTGGVRKLRWAVGVKGKSGGVRVIYYVHGIRVPIFLLTVYGKREKDNLTKAECNELALLTSALVKNYRSRS